jgi:hypothetical protein
VLGIGLANVLDDGGVRLMDQDAGTVWNGKSSADRPYVGRRLWSDSGRIEHIQIKGHRTRILDRFLQKVKTPDEPLLGLFVPAHQHGNHYPGNAEEHNEADKSEKTFHSILTVRSSILL